jgi:hypothetical protein
LVGSSCGAVFPGERWVPVALAAGSLSSRARAMPFEIKWLRALK